jgi:predicted signal transduction protein with EAL and GGDEF domain
MLQEPPANIHIPKYRARDRERNAGLLAVRLDGIEALNDRSGRASGDEAIRAVSYVPEGVRAGEGRQAHLPEASASGAIVK